MLSVTSVAIPPYENRYRESEGGAMVHEKQIRNEESAALLNSTARVSKWPSYQYAACLRAVLYPCLKERRLLEILAP